MRIISGSHRSRQFHPPAYFKARPTTDYAKESLFNILNNRFDFEDLAVIDLFSGTGSISYEFMSRGCRKVIAVEKAAKYAGYIRQTAKKLEGENVVIQVIQADAFKYLLKTDLSAIDLIFADPPYDLSNIDRLPDLVFENQTCPEQLTFILEHSGTLNFESHAYFKECRKYGKVHFSFFCQSDF